MKTFLLSLTVLLGASSANAAKLYTIGDADGLYCIVCNDNGRSCRYVHGGACVLPCGKSSVVDPTIPDCSAATHDPDASDEQKIVAENTCTAEY